MDQEYHAYLMGQIGDDGQPISTHKCAAIGTLQMRGWGAWHLPCGVPAITAIRTEQGIEPRCEAHAVAAGGPADEK